jgi:hypothetical protein
MLLPPGEGMTEEEGQVELHNASITYYILEPGERSLVPVFARPACSIQGAG